MVESAEYEPAMHVTPNAVRSRTTDLPTCPVAFAGMASTRVRDWATVDYYALLGVDPDRRRRDHHPRVPRAGEASHPDAADDAAGAERFSDVAAAYAVLSDRADAPRVRPGACRELGGPRARTPTPVAGRPQAGGAKPWSARGGRSR